MFLSAAVDVFSSLLPLSGSCGVLTAWDGVKEPRLFSASSFFVPAAKYGVHMGGKEAFFVHADADAFNAEGGGSLDGGGEGVFFRQDIFASAGEHAVGHVEGRGATDGHAALPIPVQRVVNNLNGSCQKSLSNTCAAITPLYARLQSVEAVLTLLIAHN